MRTLRRLFALAILVGAPLLSQAQSTAVTLQVTDADGIQWAGGTWQVQLIAGTSGSSGPYNILPNGPVVPNQIQSGGLTATGAATMTLTPNASIAPAGTVWYFAVCPNATTDCYRQSVTIAGASQTVTLVPPGIRINGANAPPNVRAYNDLEVVNPTIGTQYFNVSTTSQRIWLGTIWTNLGGGASSPALTLTNSPNCTTTNNFVELDTAHLDATGNATAQTASLNSKKVIGVAASGAGCSGTVSIATSLSTQVVADGQTTVGDWVAASPTAPGQANDYGAAKSTAVQTVGIVSKANTGAGTLTTIIVGTGDQLSNGSSNSNGSISNATQFKVPYYSSSGSSNVLSGDVCTTDGSGNMTCTTLATGGVGTGVVTFLSGTAPSNPASGKFALYGDSGAGTLKCLNSSGGSCLNTSPAFSSVTSGVNTQANMQVGTAATVSPLNLGQVASSQYWISTPILSAPSLSTSTTGGIIAASHGIAVVITYNTAAGETLPSLTASITTGAGGTNSVTVTAPILPSGYTGYTVYDFDGNAGGTTWLKQTASAACVNITTNCVISTVGAGSNVPTINTAWTQPPNIQATTTSVTQGQGFSPAMFIQKVDGNYYPLASVDNSACTPLLSPCGILTFTDHVFFNDTGVNIGASNSSSTGIGPIKNNLISIAHLACSGTTCAPNNDDRAVGLRFATPTTMTGNNGRMMGVYEEMWLNGTPTGLNASPDFGMHGYRITLDDVRSGGTLSSTLYNYSGLIASNVTGGATMASCNPCYQVYNATYGGSSAFTGSVAMFFGGIGASPGITGGNGFVFEATGGLTNNWSGFYADQSPAVASNTYFMRSDKSGLASILGGPLYLPSLLSDAGTLGVTGSLSATGAFTTSQLATPGASPACNAGATAYTMKLVAKDSNGSTTAAQTINFNNCASDVSGTNPLTINNISVAGASSYDAYLSSAGGTCNSGACTLGKVGSVTPTFSVAVRQPSVSFSYTGAAGDGNSAPSINTTGGIQAATYLQSTAKPFANLPTCASAFEGAMQGVTDSTTIVPGATIAGSGSNHVNAYCNGTNWVVASGGGGGGTTWMIVTGGTGTGFNPVLNATRLWAYTSPVSFASNNVGYHIATADNTANLYDIGLYDNTGSLKCHTGATAGTSFAPATGARSLAWAASCSIVAGTRYYFAITGNATTVAIGGQSNFENPQCASTPSANNTTSGGALNSSVTAPADSFASCTAPQLTVY